MAGSRIIVVESPGKVKKVSSIVGPGYKVFASAGHVADLPTKELGIDLATFDEAYHITKPDVVKKLKAAARDADQILLATDPDREGEAIAWHLMRVLGGKKTRYRRVTFDAITEDVVKAGLQNARELDQSLVAAQRARRVIDRILGWLVSPILWTAFDSKTPLSAGRVQTSTLSLVVERERAIESFVPRHYWTLHAQLVTGGVVGFWTAMVDPKEIADKADLDAIVQQVSGVAIWWIEDVDEAQESKAAPPPFTTSSLQQAASRNLKFSPARTMKAAQALYEGGWITYLRTDSTHVDAKVQAQTLDYISDQFGETYRPAQPNTHKKKAKGAQEAHECIRPAKPQLHPDDAEIEDADQRVLYRLIWQRFVASQMTPAVYAITEVSLRAGTSSKAALPYRFAARARREIFDGWRTVYRDAEERDEQDDDDITVSDLPPLKAGDELTLNDLQAKKRSTKPPARYSEANLIHEMEQRGIGRPSTYSATLETLKARHYVEVTKGKVNPTPIGITIVDFCKQYFANLFDVAYTASLETLLDRIAAGKLRYLDVVKAFHTDIQPAVKAAQAVAQKAKASRQPQLLGDICPECGKALALKRSERGDFIGCSGFPECRYARPLPMPQEQLA